MRQKHIIPLTALALAALIVAVPLSNATAAGNVLLPPVSGNTSSSLPNLGLSVPSSSATPTAAPAPVAPPPAQPVPQTPALMTPIPSGSQTPPPPINSAMHMAPGQMPTHVVQEPDPSAMFAQSQKNLPNSLVVSVSSQSTFGSSDIKTINAKLGLPFVQITKSCILTLQGILKASKTSSIFINSGSGQVQARYDGTIQGYSLSALATCSVDRLPPGSGFLKEQNGRILIPLQPIKCAPPTQQVSQMIVTYNGTPNAQCTYQ